MWLNCAATRDTTPNTAQNTLFIIIKWSQSYLDICFRISMAILEKLIKLWV